MSESTPIASVESGTADIVFWAAALVLLFWALGARSLWGSEGRWAEVVREMFLTGDFFHPRINGAPYFDKPLLSYWLIALVSSLCGRLDEWTVRVPSAASALAALWATLYLGRRLWSEETGRAAAWLLLTTYGMLFWARTAAADMENLAAIILAIAWYWSRREKSDFLTYLVFYLICFLGAQTKGLPAVAVPLVAILPDLARKRRWRRHLNRTNLLALALGVAVYLGPFIYADLSRGGYPASGLALVYRENIQRFITPFDHIEPFYVYFYYLPELFLPWAPLLLLAIVAMFASLRRLNEKTRWALEATVLVFLLFSASGSRRVYYILPILPLCALLTARFLTAAANEGLKRLAIRLQLGVLGLACLVEILSPALWPLIQAHSGFTAPTELKLATLIAGLLALLVLAIGRLRPGILRVFGQRPPRLAAVIGMAVVLMGGFFCWQQLSFEAYRTRKPFALELKREMAALGPEEVAFYGKPTTDILFYLNQPEPLPVLGQASSLQAFLKADQGIRIVVAQRRYLNNLPAELVRRLRGYLAVSERSYSWEKRKPKKHVVFAVDGTQGPERSSLGAAGLERAPGELLSR